MLVQNSLWNVPSTVGIHVGILKTKQTKVHVSKKSYLNLKKLITFLILHHLI